MVHQRWNKPAAGARRLSGQSAVPLNVHHTTVLDLSTIQLVHMTQNSTRLHIHTHTCTQPLGPPTLPRSNFREPDTPTHTAAQYNPVLLQGCSHFTSLQCTGATCRGYPFRRPALSQSWYSHISPGTVISPATLPRACQLALRPSLSKPRHPSLPSQPPPSKASSTIVCCQVTYCKHDQGTKQMYSHMLQLAGSMHQCPCSITYVLSMQ